MPKNYGGTPKRSGGPSMSKRKNKVATSEVGAPTKVSRGKGSSGRNNMTPESPTHKS